mgnify:CR=1 FL=1
MVKYLSIKSENLIFKFLAILWISLLLKIGLVVLQQFAHSIQLVLSKISLCKL